MISESSRILRRLVLPAALGLASLAAAETSFIRGRVNGDAELDVGDPVGLLFHLFAGAPAPPCSSAADADDSGQLDTSDALRLLGYLFLHGAPPAAPFPDCGIDPTADSLDCADFDACELLDPVITEWTVPWGGSRPRDPFVGPQGRVWFVGQTAHYAAYLDIGSGEFERFDLEDGAGPHNLIVDEDHVWYAGNGAAHIGRLDPSDGAILKVAMPPGASDPHTLVFNRDGDIWFTVQRGNFVGKLTKQTREVRLVRVPTASARPYGIELDSGDRPWVALFGTNKLASVDPESLQISEVVLPRSGARPRRIGLATDDSVWYVDYSEGYLGRLVPASGEITEWRAPSAGGSRPYGMAIDDRDRIWFVETGPSPNRFVGFDPLGERFFSSTAIPSGAGTVRHMYFHPATREIWFGTDANTIGRADLDR